MPKEIFGVKEFLTTVRRTDAVQVRIKKNGYNKHGTDDTNKWTPIQTKFKVRCSKYLYTFKCSDPERAKRLIESLPPSIKQVHIKWGDKKEHRMLATTKKPPAPRMNATEMAALGLTTTPRPLSLREKLGLGPFGHGWWNKKLGPFEKPRMRHVNNHRIRSEIGLGGKMSWWGRNVLKKVLKEKEDAQAQKAEAESHTKDGLGFRDRVIPGGPMVLDASFNHYNNTEYFFLTIFVAIFILAWIGLKKLHRLNRQPRPHKSLMLA